MMTNVSGALDAAMSKILPVNPVAHDPTSWPLEERLAFYNCPGVAVCVIKNGEVADMAGFGKKEVGGSAVTADTLFAGASISKPVAAALALQLVDRGQVDLDAPVNGYLKSWKIPENDFTRQKPVTLRHLLCHKAGTTVHGFGAFPSEVPPPTLKEMLTGSPPSMTPAVEVDKLPGGSVRYSGGGTQVVQQLIEDLTGREFSDVAEESIFQPLNMSRSTFRQPLSGAYRACAASGHDKDGLPVAGSFTFTPQLAAGGIYTTAPDYARFMVECRNAWLGRTNILFRQDVARLMMQRQDPGQFALGWELFGEGSSARFAHGGSNEGYQCTATCSLEEGAGAVILTNALMGIILHSEVMNAIARTYEWSHYQKAPKEIQSVSPDQQEKIIGRYDIISGISAPHIDVWTDQGQLHSYVEGLIFPPRPIYLGQNGRFFTQQTSSETRFEFDEKGEAISLTTFGEGEVELLRAIKRA
jgi:CubicO group peptidase (beta-lactamase class C family)